MSIGFTICLVVTRAIHFGASLLMLGVWMFDLIARDVLDEFASIWRQLAKRLIWIAIWAVMVSGVAWFVQVTMNMSGVGFGEAIHPSVLHLVWSETQFGQVWKWRAIFWIFCVFVSYRKTEAATFGSPFVERGDAGVAATFRIIRAIAGILLVASLAWSGHGQTGFARPWHLSADILHLLICSIWPIGLLP
ncbi:MAG TPA: hypothetical protein VHS31_13620, partial [Tepidisphaeraceae bacterium]|nr:hypothetical protein [Tepidisphaeraceae bacterium]